MYIHGYCDERWFSAVHKFALGDYVDTSVLTLRAIGIFLASLVDELTGQWTTS